MTIIRCSYRVLRAVRQFSRNSPLAANTRRNTLVADALASRGMIGTLCPRLAANLIPIIIAVSKSNRR